MSASRVSVIALTVACLACAAAPAFAQVPPSQGRGGAGQRAGGGPRAGGLPEVTPNMSVAEVERLFDNWEILHAKAPLQLDDQAFMTFMPRFKQVLLVQRQHQASRQRQIMELANLMKPEVATDEAVLSVKTKAVDDLEAQQIQDLQKALAAVDQVLTVKQRARLRVFMNNMERQKLDLIAQARQQAQQIKSSTPAPGKIIK